MYAWQFATALQLAMRHGWTRFITMQNHVNLLYREEEREMLPLCRAEGIGVLPWSPLARGRLTRDWRETSAREETDEVGKKLYAAAVDADRAVIDAVAAVASTRGVPRAQVALAWLVQQPGITSPIIGASRLGHLEDAVAALDLSLTSEERAALGAPYVPHPISGI
jgi:aryl-alcohol dehydrogenase-like predicted oxidoreductase